MRPAYVEQEIAALASQSENITMDAEVARYTHNIISFLRLHRAVKGGMSPIATKFFDKLVR